MTGAFKMTLVFRFGFIIAVAYVCAVANAADDDANLYIASVYRGEAEEDRSSQFRRLAVAASAGAIEGERDIRIASDLLRSWRGWNRATTQTFDADNNRPLQVAALMALVEIAPDEASQHYVLIRLAEAIGFVEVDEDGMLPPYDERTRLFLDRIRRDGVEAVKLMLFGKWIEWHAE